MLQNDIGLNLGSGIDLNGDGITDVWNSNDLMDNLDSFEFGPDLLDTGLADSLDGIDALDALDSFDF